VGEGLAVTTITNRARSPLRMSDFALQLPATTADRVAGCIHRDL
jgi:hypothetical protein